MGAQTLLNTMSFGGTDALGLTTDSQNEYAGRGVSEVASNVARDALIAAATGGAGNAAMAPTASATRQLTMTGVRAAGSTYLLGQDARAIGDGVGMIRAGRPIRGLVSAVGGMAGVRGGFADDVARMGNAGRGAADVAGGAPAGGPIMAPASEAAARCTGFKAFSSRNFRDNLSHLTGNTPVGAQAHHNLPQKFEVDFSRLGIDIHDPRYGSWWSKGDHARNSAAYNKAWDRFLQTNPTREQALNFGRELAKNYGLQTHF